MENIIYEIETHDGEMKKFDKRTLKDSIDDLLSDIAVIKKTYKYNNKKILSTVILFIHPFIKIKIY